MSLSNPDPTCTVNATSTVNGVDVTGSSTVTIALADTAGVKQWNLTCINTDENHVAATITASLTVDLVGKTATFTAPSDDCALIFQSKVNNGRDSNGVLDPSLSTTFGVYVLTMGGQRVGAFDEKTEGNAAFGWVAKVNPVIRASASGLVTYGDGLHLSGTVVSVKPDSYILVGTSGVSVDATSANTASKVVVRDASGNFAAGQITASALIVAGDGTINNPKFGAQKTETRVCSQLGVDRAPTSWTYTNDNYTNVMIGRSLSFRFDPPHGSVIYSFVVNYIGGPGHVGLPASMPTIALYTYDLATHTAAQVASSTGTDASANVAAFEAWHKITADNGGLGIGHTVDRSTKRYFILVTAESGANALVGGVTDGPSVTWNRTISSNIGQD